MAELSAAGQATAALSQLWTEHATDPIGVLARLPPLGAGMDEADLPAWVALAVHVCGPAHLGDPARGQLLLDGVRFVQHPAVRRGRGVLHLHAGALAEAEALLDAAPPACEAWVWLTAAHGAAAAGQIPEAATWFERGAKLVPLIADQDVQLAELQSLADRIGRLLLEDAAPRDLLGRRLLRHATTLARTVAERSGGWREVERAEALLAAASLALGEPTAAAAHALAAAALCRHHQAPTDHALALVEQARRAREP